MANNHFTNRIRKDESEVIIKERLAMGKWRLHMGCHNGGIVSRDSFNSEKDTEEEVRKLYQKSKRFYRSIGYFVWFATITSPKGEVVLQDNGVPYKR